MGPSNARGIRAELSPEHNGQVTFSGEPSTRSDAHMKKKLLALLIGALLPVSAALAADSEAVDVLRETTLNILDALVKRGVLNRQEADEIVKDAESKARTGRAAAKPQPDDVRVTYVPETVKDEIRREVRRDVLEQTKAERWALPGVLPEWMDRISFYGDFLLRAQTDLFQQTNSTQYPNFQAINQAGTVNISNATLYTDPADPTKVADNRERFFLRARLGVNAKITDTVSTGLRLTTGNTSQPVVTVQSLGNSENKYSFLIDRAFLRLQPVPWLDVAGGRIQNPFLHSELIWAPDLSFEGFAATVRQKVGGVTPWFTAGAFPLQELGSNERNKWLYAGQGGVEWNLTPQLRSRVGLAYYNYRNITGAHNPAVGDTHVNDFTAPQFVQKGNTLFNIADTTLDPNAALFALASEYRLLNLTGTLDLLAYDPYHVLLTGDFVQNLAYDQASVLARTGLNIAPRTKGYLVKLAIGKPDLAEAGDWLVQFGYRYLQRDAVLDAFTDPDFHLGGTDTKGHTLYLAYAFGRNAYASLKWMSANAVDGPQLAIDVLQVDMNVRF